MNRKIVPISLVAAALGVLSDVLFFEKPLGVSVVIFTSLLTGALLLLASEFRHKLTAATSALLGMVLFLAAMLAIRASGMLFFFNSVLILYLLLLILKLSQKLAAGLKSYGLSDYVTAIPGLPFGILRRSTAEIRGLIRHTPAEKSAYAPWIRGAVLSLPFLVVFFLLFSSADAVFQQYVGSLFKLHLSDKLVGHIFYIGVGFVGLLGALAMFFMPDDAATAKTAKSRADLGATEASIILGSVAVLFFIFLLVQLTYLFGGENRVLSTGLTYAEYARRGFFELIAVAVITMAMLLGVKQLFSPAGGRDLRRFTWLSSLLIAEVLVIMLSAHLRLSLYEQAYGFTRLRLFSHMFIFWLAAAFVLLALFIIRRQQERTFAFSLFVSVMAFFVVLNVINPDALVARQNIARYHDAGKLDRSYLMQLSEDATPAMLGLLSQKATDDSQNLARHLYAQQQNLKCGYAGWQSANLSRSRAASLLGRSSQVAAEAPRAPQNCPGSAD